MTILFGFLPWCEVSCYRRNIEIRLSQSGFQALYGGVSSPLAMEEMLSQEFERGQATLGEQQRMQGLHKMLEVEQSYLANVSPFLVLFWGANLALLGIICFVPLGAWRLRFVLPLCGVMLMVLILHAGLGLPLERGVGQLIGEAVRKNGPDWMVWFPAIKACKTFWFWLTFGLVILVALTEPLFNWLRAERWGGWLVPSSIVGGATGLMVVALVVQFVLREATAGNLENRIAQIRQAEEEKRQQAEGEQQRREEERFADVRRQEAEAEYMRQQAALKAEEARLLEQRRLREQEEEARRRRKEREQAELRELLEQRRQEEEAQRKKEQHAKEEADREAAKKAEEARKLKAEIEREAARKSDLEKKGQPYYPRPRTFEGGHNADEWYRLLRDNPVNARNYAQTTAALAALKSEGIPYLLDNLSRQKTPRDRHAALQLIHIEYVHNNDLNKIVSCLDRNQNFQSTRLLALQYLEKRGKDLNKALVPQIERLVEDLLDNPTLKEETKDEIRSRLQMIRREANSESASQQR
jgi:hypothetical protein